MDKDLRQSQLISRSLEERLIRAWETTYDNNSYYYELVTFPLSSIERVKSSGPNAAVIVLRSGINIRVALTHQQLEQKIYMPDLREDGWILDLCAITGKAIAPPLEIGDRAEDGTVYLGLHEDKEWYVAGKDAELTMAFNDAARYATELRAHQHADWKIPDKNILNILYKNRTISALKGTLDESGNGETGWYWSSTAQSDSHATEINFQTGENKVYGKGYKLSVRCVRSEPRR